MTNLKGNEMCPWNVERRARAESIEEVIRREKQDQLELEEQMEKFAEMERLEKQKEKEKAAAKR